MKARKREALRDLPPIPEPVVLADFDPDDTAGKYRAMFAAIRARHDWERETGLKLWSDRSCFCGPWEPVSSAEYKRREDVERLTRRNGRW